MREHVMPVFIRLILPLLLGGVFAAIFISKMGVGKETKFEELALGANTVSVFAEINGSKIHCSKLEEGQPCITDYQKSGNNEDVVLWLGNSQVHAINQYKEGQENGPPILHRKLAADDLYLLTYSLPNANLQEHYLLFEYVKSKVPVKKLILPVVFDDLRESGIRHGIFTALNDAETRKVLSHTQIGSQIIERNNTTGEDADLAALDETVQEKSEKFLNDWLDEHSGLWHARPEMRGKLFTNLYYFRNTVFNIKPTSKRKIIRGRYEENIAAMRAMLESARENDIAVLMYIVPIRSDVEIPYVKKEYERFKKDVEMLADEFGADFVNLENLVPAKYWGTKANTGIGKEGELDFMHFQAPGHALLGEGIYKNLNIQQGADRGKSP